MMEKPLTVVLTCPRIVATFVRQDERILSTRCNVVLISVAGLDSVVQMWRAMKDADCALLWFIGRHALPTVLLARARHIPVIAVIGGFEVAWEKDIGYGVRPGSVSARMLEWVLCRTRAIVTVSRFSHDLTSARFPGLADRVILIPNAVDTDRFTPSATTVRSGVLCVSTLSRSAINVKALSVFRAAAGAMPDTAFTLVGPAVDSAGRQFVASLPTNVRWRGQLSGESLIAAYREASVFFLASRHESFSLALAEAMSCGCVPVISANGALPEVGGPVARILSNTSVEECRRAITDALATSVSDRELARQHIVDHYGIERRRQSLIGLITTIATQR